MLACQISPGGAQAECHVDGNVEGDCTDRWRFVSQQLLCEPKKPEDRGPGRTTPVGIITRSLQVPDHTSSTKFKASNDGTGMSRIRANEVHDHPNCTEQIDGSGRSGVQCRASKPPEWELEVSQVADAGPVGHHIQVTDQYLGHMLVHDAHRAAVTGEAVQRGSTPIDNACSSVHRESLAQLHHDGRGHLNRWQLKWIGTSDKIYNRRADIRTGSPSPSQDAREVVAKHSREGACTALAVADVAHPSCAAGSSCEHLEVKLAGCRAQSRQGGAKCVPCSQYFAQRRTERLNQPVCSIRRERRPQAINQGGDLRRGSRVLDEYAFPEDDAGGSTSVGIVTRHERTQVLVGQLRGPVQCMQQGDSRTRIGARLGGGQGDKRGTQLLAAELGPPALHRKPLQAASDRRAKCLKRGNSYLRVDVRDVAIKAPDAILG